MDLILQHKIEEFQLASFLELTYDKLQLSRLELPRWCVTQSHLDSVVGCDISPPAKKILFLLLLSS